MCKYVQLQNVAGDFLTALIHLNLKIESNQYNELVKNNNSIEKLSYQAIDTSRDIHDFLVAIGMV